MTEPHQAPPGWYQDPARPELEFWWDGSAWGASRSVGAATPTLDPVVTPPTPSPTSMPLVALIFALVIPPVGLVLGLVALISARRQGRSAGALSTVAMIVGAVLTVMAIVLAVGIPAALDAADRTERRFVFCESFRSDPNVMLEIENLAPEADALWQEGQDGGGVSSAGWDQARADFADQLETLHERIYIQSVGFSDPDGRFTTWGLWADVDFMISGNYTGDGVAAVVRAGEISSSGGIGMDYHDEGPSWVSGLGAELASTTAKAQDAAISACAQ